MAAVSTWAQIVALLRKAMAEGIGEDVTDASLTVQQNEETVSIIGSLTVKKPAPPAA